MVGLQHLELEQIIERDFPELELSDGEPEVVISYGGDGTLLYAERVFPGIPKAAVRNSKICNLCSDLSPNDLLAKLVSGEYEVHEYMKLQGESKGVVMIAVNDVIVGSPTVNGTLRVNVYVNGQLCGEEVMGDGVILATPIGSSGYYQSITRSSFQTGIGVAFNNTVDARDHILVSKDSTIEIEIVRGPGVFAIDNGDKYVELDVGDRVLIKRASEKFAMVKFPGESSRVVGE